MGEEPVTFRSPPLIGYSGMGEARRPAHGAQRLEALLALLAWGVTCREKLLPWGTGVLTRGETAILQESRRQYPTRRCHTYRY